MELGLLDHVEQRAKRELLRKQLESRFGSLPSAAVVRLDAWPSDRLTDLGCALLSAASLEEMGLASSAIEDS